jgi:small-conductance mechanosensitive channel
MLFSGKQWETSSLGRAPQRSVILAQVGVDNVLVAMKNIHRWGFVFIAIGIALWMSGVSPQLGSLIFVIGLVGLVIAWATKS